MTVLCIAMLRCEEEPLLRSHQQQQQPPLPQCQSRLTACAVVAGGE